MAVVMVCGMDSDTLFMFFMWNSHISLVLNDSGHMEALRVLLRLHRGAVLDLDSCQDVAVGIGVES
jgi:hypothetical protein